MFAAPITQSAVDWLDRKHFLVSPRSSSNVNCRGSPSRRNPRGWLARLGAKSLHITPGSPWENGYCESFNGRLRDELPNGENLSTLREAQVLIERWRVSYNTRRSHGSLGLGLSRHA